jgi:hypothetical protein
MRIIVYDKHGAPVPIRTIVAALICRQTLK